MLQKLFENCIKYLNEIGKMRGFYLIKNGFVVVPLSVVIVIK